MFYRFIAEYFRNLFYIGAIFLTLGVFVVFSSQYPLVFIALVLMCLAALFTWGSM